MRPQPSKRRWETITFRPVGRVDFPLIASWLAEPHVARWWNQEFTIDAIERDFGPRIDGTEPGEDYLILVDKRPVGLIQHYQFADYPEYVEELATVMAVPDHAVSIDYLIGDPTLTGHGLGTAMLSRFVDHLWQTNPEAACIIVPVNTANEASWKALLAAGFQVVARGEMEPDNPIDDRQHEILRADRPPTLRG